MAQRAGRVSFDDDFLPPMDLTAIPRIARERHSSADRTLGVDEELKLSKGRMRLLSQKSNHVPLILHSTRRGLNPIHDNGEIRLAAVACDSSEQPFSPQDMDAADAVDSTEGIPGLLPESGYQVYNRVDLREHERETNTLRSHKKKH